MRRVVREAMSVRLALMALAVMSVFLVGEAGLAAGATPARVHMTPPLGGKQWLLYWFWDGQNQKGPCALLFNANGTLAGDSDGNCQTTQGSWQLSGNTVNFTLKHSCDSQWTATYDTSNGEFDNGTMEALGPSCGGNEGTFWLSLAGRIDGITFNGTEATPSIVTTGFQFGNKPASEAVPDIAPQPDMISSGASSTSKTSAAAGSQDNPVTASVSLSAPTRVPSIDYTFGSFYDSSPDNFVLNPGDQLTVAVHGRTVLAYVDGFAGGSETDAPTLAEVESPTFV